MASLSSIGIGSGLDANLIERLMAAERAPSQNRLDKATESTRTQVSAFGALKSALSGLESAIKKFDGDAAASGRKAVVGEGAGYAANTSQKAVPGNYEIVVEQIATAHKLQSAALPRNGENSPLVGHGTLRVQLGDGETISIEIAPDKSSLKDIRDALNAAGSGQFSASIVKGDGGDVLSITSQKTGHAGALTISSEGGDGGLAQLTTVGGLHTHTAAQDAIVRVDGVTS
ncbi:MAG: flagellar cap protein FliD N-terminal domain-containing protein, partial [Pseudomonadota bacterium]|nr:flagellar cap protein FliD N-terminal domain-containing protein [Pseudomonadota bacterium]